MGESPMQIKWSTALIDLVTLGIGGILLLIMVTSVSPTRRGIYCEDESIHYPFRPSTVPNYLLYIYGFTIPFALIIITEVFANRRSRSSAHFLCRPLPIWITFLYRSFVDFLFGAAASQLIVDVGKYTIGRLRPNFIDVCGPSNIDFTNCAKYNHTYITDYVCTKSDHDASESRVSFPSGHSSFSAYTMLYCAIYIQVKWPVARRSMFRLVKHALQLTLVLLAYFTALSRVMDNKHHWSDVTAGSLIGVISASLTARYVSKLVAGSPTIRASSVRDATENFEGIPRDVESGAVPRSPKNNQTNSRIGDTPSSTSALLLPDGSSNLSDSSSSTIISP